MDKCKDILDQLEAQVEDPIVTNTIDNSKEINDLKNDVADIRKMIEDAKKMFMGGFPKPPMPPMPGESRIPPFLQIPHWLPPLLPVRPPSRWPPPITWKPAERLQ